MQTAIETIGLTKYYEKDKIILNDVAIKIAKGEIFGIIGRSGSGKSTLLNSLNLLEKPNSGQIIINNINLMLATKQELKKQRQKIGIIFQNFNLLSSKNIFDNIALPLKLNSSLSSAAIKTKVNELLKLVELTNYAKKYPHNLSGGQKQRVAIARALITNPDILLSDEATSSLDPQATNNILELLLRINKKFNITIVVVTHELDVIRKICDRVAVLDNGSIVEVDNVTNIILHPKHKITRKFILEEEIDKYLEQIIEFYKFHKTSNTHLLIISFIGAITFEPVLSTVSLESGVLFSILRGELGRIKKMPFGQLLLEIKGNAMQLNKAFLLLNGLGITYEILN